MSSFSRMDSLTKILKKKMTNQLNNDFVSEKSNEFDPYKSSGKRKRAQAIYTKERINQNITVKTDMLDYPKILDNIRENYCSKSYASKKTLKNSFYRNFYYNLMIFL